MRLRHLWSRHCAPQERRSVDVKTRGVVDVATGGNATPPPSGSSRQNATPSVWSSFPACCSGSSRQNATPSVWSSFPACCSEPLSPIAIRFPPTECKTNPQACKPTPSGLQTPSLQPSFPACPASLSQFPSGLPKKSAQHPISPLKSRSPAPPPGSRRAGRPGTRRRRRNSGGDGWFCRENDHIHQRYHTFYLGSATGSGGSMLSGMGSAKVGGGEPGCGRWAWGRIGRAAWG